MMLDDHGVSTDGIAVYEVAYQVGFLFLITFYRKYHNFVFRELYFISKTFFS